MTDNNTPKPIQLTAEGLEELKSELQRLKEIELPEVINRVATARTHGDLSENSEYHNAKEDQQLTETRISEIEDILERATVIKATKNTDKIGVGSTVDCYIKEDKKKHFTFHIVGEYEAVPAEGKISSVSPLGKALMNKKKGDEAKVLAPAGEIIYVIKDIR
jgi:transcription elongation factor GreA